MDSCFQIDDDALAELLKQVLSDYYRKAEPIICSDPTYVGLRQHGVLFRDYWLDDGELISALRGTMIPALWQGDFKGVDTIELCLTRHYRRVPLQDFKSKFPNTKIGIRGIKLQYQSHVALYTPTQMIAHNLTFKQVFETFLELVSLSAEAFEKNGGIIESFEARQVLVSLDPLPKVVMMHRGNQIVPLEGMSQQTISDMAFGMGEWLLRMCVEDGHLTYKYLPSQDKELNLDNMTCQFMATLCLIRYAKFTGQPDHLALANRNLNYNLEQYYQIESEAGILKYQDKARLGAAAIAALAILEHPHGDRYRDIFQRLCQEIEALWQPDGSLRTSRKFSKRDNKHQNLHPGLALLFWASLYKANWDQQLLERCYKSFFYYQEWYRDNRHPAFIPWHSQACTVLFEETGDRIFRDFVFEMNDWLLSMQQWDNLRSIDARGRFYDPTHREYGLPNAAATGSYLQSLVDAYRLAVQNSDTARANAYELGIWRGLRSIRQLQFKDDVDMFYIPERAKVQGAVRTTVYDNTIRLDNVQQSLMAILKCHLPEFPKQAPQPKLSFRLMKRGVDIAPLLAEITEKSAFWLYDTSRQQKLSVQEATQSIFLRRAAKPFPPGITNARDVHESCPTEIAQEFPVAMNWVEGFVKEIGGELGRVNIVRLAPKDRVHRHIDNGEYYRLRDRYHLILQSQSGSWMKCGDEEVLMHEGELWWFDNKQPHEAFNPSEEWRIHIIFDVLPQG